MDAVSTQVERFAVIGSKTAQEAVILVPGTHAADVERMQDFEISIDDDEVTLAGGGVTLSIRGANEHSREVLAMAQGVSLLAVKDVDSAATGGDILAGAESAARRT